jgi:hypothetical protein
MVMGTKRRASIVTMSEPMRNIAERSANSPMNVPLMWKRNEPAPTSMLVIPTR